MWLRLSDTLARSSSSKEFRTGGFRVGFLLADLKVLPANSSALPALVLALVVWPGEHTRCRGDPTLLPR